VVPLSQVLSGHIKSCGCVKHQRHVEHTQRAVDRLTPAQIKQCFLFVVDRKATRPDISKYVIDSAYYRRAESLKSLPDSTMVTVQKRVMAHDDYASIARDTGLEAFEVAWLAKHVIRPKSKQGRVEQQEMKDHALRNIDYAKEGREREAHEWCREHREREWGRDYKEWRRERELQKERFSASELHTPGTKASEKARLDFDSLDFAWHWMKTSAPHMKLDSDEQDLLRWFRETAERTFQWRRDNRRDMARRQSEKKWNDIEAAA
jgi:hypothetical protein